MDVADPQRPAVEKLRLALALKVAGDVCPDDLLRDWIKQYDDTGDVRRWVADNESADDAPKRRQLEAERREKFAEVCRRVDALTRSEIARRVLAADGAGLLPAIGGKAPGRAARLHAGVVGRQARCPGRPVQAGRRATRPRARLRRSPTCACRWPAPWSAPAPATARSWASSCSPTGSTTGACRR